jgi:hypothetical protein
MFSKNGSLDFSSQNIIIQKSLLSILLGLTSFSPLFFVSVFLYFSRKLLYFQINSGLFIKSISKVKFSLSILSVGYDFKLSSDFLKSSGNQAIRSILFASFIQKSFFNHHLIILVNDESSFSSTRNDLNHATILLTIVCEVLSISFLSTIFPTTGTDAISGAITFDEIASSALFEYSSTTFISFLFFLTSKSKVFNSIVVEVQFSSESRFHAKLSL